MVVREDPDSAAVLCIPQSGHAAISGRLAAAWGNEQFEVPEPRPEVIEAATRHDDGMDDFDAEPELDPETGLPRSFMRMPLQTWLQCWRQGPSLVAEDSPYAGILVSLHGGGLLGYRRLDDPDEARMAAEWLAEQEQLRDEWAGEAERRPELAPGLGREALERNRSLIASWDAISLALCMPRLPDGFDRVPECGGETVRIEIDVLESGSGLEGPRLLAVDPWPFAADSLQLEASGRLLEGRFQERQQMQAALAAAELRTLSFTLIAA